ncbi:MAG: hypothetical protein ABSF69_04605 [Polyangiaceae bacterium]|jgi:hypothetical protein
MRWLVEVTPLGGGSETESVMVEADTWQSALINVRAGRGETEGLSGFSIELLESGCRAVDPTSRIRYQVRPSPREGADRPGENAGSPESATPAGDVSPRPSAGPTEAVNARPSGPPRETVSPRQSVPPFQTETLAWANPPVYVTSSPSRYASSIPPRLSGHGIQAPKIAASTVPVPISVPPPAADEIPRAPLVAAIETSAASAAKAVVPADRKPSTPAPPTGVASQILFKREEDRTAALPITYREYVYLVPPGTTSSMAERLLRVQLDVLRTSLTPVPVGKLVNLAAFDVPFEGRPPVAPLATLTWKDWQGTAVVSFPRRQTQSSAPKSHAPSAAPPAQVSARVSNGLSLPVEPTAAETANPRAPGGPADEPEAPTVDEARSSARVSPADALAGAESVGALLGPEERIAASFEPGPSAVSAGVRTEESSLRIAEGPSQASIASTSERPSAPRARVRGEDLIADLFEAMHELHFMRDAVEAGAFCLALSMEKIPCRAGIVHIYDIDRREFLVINTRGEAAKSLLLRRYPEGDLALHAATGKRRPVVLTYASEAESQSLERYAAIGGVRGALVAPAMMAGRFLGALELLDPLDGQPFADSDVYAMAYIAEQFAQFVSEHGVVTEPDRIRR